MGFKIFLVLSIFNLPQFSTFPPLTEESRRTQFQSSREQRVQVSWFQLQIQIRIADRFPACSVLRVFLLSIQEQVSSLLRHTGVHPIYRGQVSSLLRPTGVHPIYRGQVSSLHRPSEVYPIQRIGFQFTPSYWSLSYIQQVSSLLRHILELVLYTEDRFIVYSVLMEFILYRGEVSSLLRPIGVHPIQRIDLQFTPS